MNPRTPKLVLPLEQHEAVGSPVPLKAIYVLSPPRARSNRLARPRVRPLGGREAFLEVVRSTFNLLVLREERLAGQFRFARNITATVPIRQLAYPRDLSQLPEVCNVVLGDLAKLDA